LIEQLEPVGNAQWFRRFRGSMARRFKTNRLSGRNPREFVAGAYPILLGNCLGNGQLQFAGYFAHFLTLARISSLFNPAPVPADWVWIDLQKPIHPRLYPQGRSQSNAWQLRSRQSAQDSRPNPPGEVHGHLTPATLQKVDQALKNSLAILKSIVCPQSSN
jgi:hypothetical protein